MVTKSAQGKVSVNDDFQPEIEGLEEGQLGFPAYWTASEELNSKGNHGSFYATVIGFDDSDPDFERWIFQAKHRMRCYRGKVENQEEVIVEAGDFFSTSNFVQFRLNLYIGEDIQLTAMEKIAMEKGKTMWVWKLHAKPEVHARIAKAKQGIMRGNSQMAHPKSATEVSATP